MHGGPSIGKAELAAILAREDHALLVEAARTARGRVLRFVAGRLASPDPEEKRRAVAALGALVRAAGLLDDEAVRDILRRFAWAMNDESGAVPHGIPEAMGEVLASRPALRADFLPLLGGYLTEEEALQTGPVERGVMWGLARVGGEAAERCPDAVRALEVAAARHPDPGTRAEAARALAAIRGPSGAGS